MGGGAVRGVGLDFPVAVEGNWDGRPGESVGGRVKLPDGNLVRAVAP